MSEDYQNFMIVMATGLDQTYLAAFFARKFNRILLVAHPEEILKYENSTFEHALDVKAAFIMSLKKNNDQILFGFIYTSIYCVLIINKDW